MFSRQATSKYGKGNRTQVRRLRKSLFESLEDRRLMATDLYVSTTGDDWADGTIQHPFQTIRRALDAAAPGDTITLRGGVHAGGINIDIDNLTIRSMPGEWAVIESPLTELTDGRANSVIRYGFDVQGGRLENVEITGGYWYGVMFWDWWDPTWQAGTTHVGASGITLDGVKVHDTGVDAIKLTPGANDISILNSEIYNTGRRSPGSADGIDNNNGDRMIARGNYLHHIAANGILTSGGTEDSLVEQNLVAETGGAGIVVGYYSEAEWMDPATNPHYYTSIDTVARNNIIVDAGQAGIGVYASLNPQVYNNTIVNAAANAQAPLQFAGIELWLSDADPWHHVTSVDPLVVNNIITTAPDNDTRMVDIREGSYAGTLTLDHNLYHGSHERGVLFIDRNLTGDGTPEQTFSQWQANYSYDANSLVADPQLGTDWHLLAASPAIGRAIPLVGLANDFDGNLRVADPPTPDLGADEFDAGAIRPTPPAAFGAPSLEIASRGYHDYENNVIQVRVVRHGSTAGTVTVQYATLEGTAKAGQDFVATAGTLTFAPGETEKLVPVQLLADSLPEGDERLLFSLSNPTTTGSDPVRFGHQSSASVTIDDLQTPITLSYATRWVSNSGSDVTGDGSQASPWKSLQHAADNVGPGDYVIVEPGQYWGMNMTRDGKPDARITFHALPGVVIDEPDPERRQDGINLEGADYVTIEGFEIHGMPRAGLRSVNNTGVILRGNITDNNGWWGILTGWSENILVENNVASRSQNEHGIYISNSSDDGVVRNNIVWGNNDSGIQFNADVYLAGDGIHSRNVVEGNVIYGNGLGGGAAINLDGFQDGVVQNNLLYDNHATGIVLYVGYAADSSTNNLVTNNTVVMAADARWALLMQDGSSGNVVTNNVLLNRNPNRGSMTVDHGSLPALSDHNMVQNLFQLDGYGATFAHWQAFSGGQDAHSILASIDNLDELFIDAAAGDFRPQSGSALIDSGDAAHAPAVDLYQHARPSGGGVDIGALEAGEFVPAVQFEWADTVAYEFIGMAEVAVTCTGDTAGVTVVDVTSNGGTASAADYSPVNVQLVFQPGQTRKTFRVFVNNDSAIEDNETVGLALNVVGDPTGVGPADTATLHILSDDSWQPGRLQFDAASVTFDETAGVALVTVHRVGGANGAASVSYSTDLFQPARQATWIKRHTDILYPTDRDTPATAGADYVTQFGTLEFADGETTKTIAIQLLNDDWYEQGEAFVLRLSEPTGGATLGAQSQLKVRIASEDLKLPGTFVFASPAYSVTEGTPSVNVTVNRLGGGNVEASVRLYHTGAGDGSTTASAWAPFDYGWLPEALTFAPGEMSRTITIPIVDDTSTEIAEQFSILLYSPSNDATVGTTATTWVTIHDNESTFVFRGATAAAWSFEAVEGSGLLPVTVVRQGALGASASVQVNTGNSGSATPGVDFTPVNVTLNFAAGEASKTIYVPLVNDSLMEAKESIAIAMSNAAGASLGSSTWSGYIVDDDVAASPGKLELAAAALSTSEGVGTLNLTVNRVGGSDGTVTVQYRTLDGAAGAAGDAIAYAGADYTSRTGTLTFAPGEISKVISIPITDDTRVEKNELFSVELRTPGGGATIGAVAKSAVTIAENDSAIEFAQTAYTASEAAGYVTLTLVRKGSTAGAATIDLNLSSGSATAGADYIKPASNKVSFADGESTKQVQIQIIDDILSEADEMFYLTLTNAVGAQLGSSLWGNVKITSNE